MRPSRGAIKPRSFFSRLGGAYTSPGGEAFERNRPLSGCLDADHCYDGHQRARCVLPDLKDRLDGAAQLESMVEQGTLTKRQMEQQMAVISRFAGTGCLGRNWESPDNTCHHRSVQADQLLSSAPKIGLKRFLQ